MPPATKGMRRNKPNTRRALPGLPSAPSELILRSEGWSIPRHPGGPVGRTTTHRLKHNTSLSTIGHGTQENIKGLSRQICKSDPFFYFIGLLNHRLLPFNFMLQWTSATLRYLLWIYKMAHILSLSYYKGWKSKNFKCEVLIFIWGELRQKALFTKSAKIRHLLSQIKCSCS